MRLYWTQVTFVLTSSAASWAVGMADRLSASRCSDSSRCSDQAIVSVRPGHFSPWEPFPERLEKTATIMLVDTLIVLVRKKKMGV
jgi:hypothetical protein